MESRIYRGVRRGCGLSPILLIIYMKAIIKEWRQKPHGCIPIGRNLQLDVILFADDLESTEDDLQCFIYNIHTMASKHNMEISIKKSKVMAFCGKEPVTSQICLNNKLIGRTNDFRYLGHKLSFHGETDLPQTLQNTQELWVL
jgi:hypothetical protein